MSKWHIVEEVAAAAQRRAVAHRTAEFVVAVGVSVAVQLAALPSACREHAARALLGAVGLRW